MHNATRSDTSSRLSRGVCGLTLLPMLFSCARMQPKNRSTSLVAICIALSMLWTQAAHLHTHVFDHRVDGEQHDSAPHSVYVNALAHDGHVAEIDLNTDVVPPLTALWPLLAFAVLGAFTLGAVRVHFVRRVVASPFLPQAVLLRPPLRAPPRV